MEPRLLISSSQLSQQQKALHEYAVDGLRTLVMGSRALSLK